MRRITVLKRKNVLALLTAAVLLFTGCGSGAAESGTESSASSSDDDKKTYTIEVISDSDDDASALVSEGIQAAADKYFNTDESKLDIQFEVGKSTDKDLKEIIDKEPDLIITNGERSLVAAAKATEEIPIVASNVMNYQQIVGLEAAQDGTWDRLTGRNITGISSAPNVTATLSLIIEATQNLESVGILYTSYDSDAVFQDSRLEDYLDQAGIKWTEYEVPLPGQTSVAAPSGTDSTSENQTSESTASENTSVSDGTTSSDGTASSDTDSANAAPDASAQASLSPEQIIAQAVADNSVIFVSRNSLLSGQAEAIASAAKNAGKGLIASDDVFGPYALATLYSDPYQEGYSAGTLAKSVLIDEKNIEKIKVREISFSNEHKLYNASYAESMGITFPKSFTEYNTFFEEQSAGENSAENEDG